eukprot:13774212-Alexandrium_andersonii.AAC.1
MLCSGSAGLASACACCAYLCGGLDLAGSACPAICCNGGFAGAAGHACACCPASDLACFASACC